MYWHNTILIVRVVELLSRRNGVTKAEMAAHLNMTRRNVDRVFDLMQELGFPIYDEKVPYETENRWRLVPGRNLGPLYIPQLDWSEIFSLYLIRGEMRLFKGSAIRKNVDSAFRKLRAIVPDNLATSLDRIGDLFVSCRKLLKDYSNKEQVIDELRDAMILRKVCYVKYHSFRTDEVKNYTLEPLHFFENEGGLYILANIREYKEVRVLAVERFHEVLTSADRFDYPQGFVPEEYLTSTFGIIRDREVSVAIWFSKDVARYIKERTWVPDQQIREDEETGGVVLEMSTGGWMDVKRWVLSYGEKARVLEPKELRDEIAAELKRAAAGYA